MSKIKLILGDCIEQLKTIPDNSIDSVVSDPPAGISFMGKKWDNDKGGRKQWIAWMTEVMQEVNRVLKPGGHAFIWALPRTQHWTGTAIEDAGLEVRDVVSHVFGSGFPKSHNIGKNIEKRKVGGIKNLKQIDTKKGIKTENGSEGYSYNKEYVAGKCMGGKQITGDIPVYEITNEYEGWGTGLKPASENWILGKKDGGEDIDIDSKFVYQAKPSKKEKNAGCEGYKIKIEINTSTVKHLGEIDIYNNKIIWQREALQKKVIEEFGIKPNKEMLWNIEQFGKHFMDQLQKDYKSTTKTETNSTMIYQTLNLLIRSYIKENIATQLNEKMVGIKYVENVEKKNTKVYITSQKKDGSNPSVNLVPLKEIVNVTLEENRNIHNTVKSIKLMKYLINMITPVGGVVLDPFLGSGSTGVAAVEDGFSFIGIEKELEYIKIAKARIEHKYNEVKNEK